MEQAIGECFLPLVLSLSIALAFSWHLASFRNMIGIKKAVYFARSFSWELRAVRHSTSVSLLEAIFDIPSQISFHELVIERAKRAHSLVMTFEIFHNYIDICVYMCTCVNGGVI